MIQEKYDFIVVGAGLTGLTTAFYLERQGLRTAIVEKSDRVGGVIRTIRKDGFIFEAGPNTGVYSSPALVRLFDDLGDRAEPEFANRKAKQRWIWKKGQWHPLPSGPVSAIKTPLFTFGDKIRILGEPFRKMGTEPNETVAGLVKRRMGKSFLDYAVDPFISGIYAGDPDRLVTRFALPKLYNLEQKYGSFIGGSAKKRREPKTELEKRATREVFSVKGGLQSLTDALGDSISEENKYLGCADVKVEKSGHGYQVSFTQKGEAKKIGTKKVITTIPGYALNGMLPFVKEELLQPVRQLTYAKVVEVVAAYKLWKGIPLNAFGGLIPSKEQRQALGILFTSSIFPGRTPDGGAILSVFMGGMRRPDIIEMSDEELRTVALREISETMHVTDAPDHLEIFRYEHAIPQYDASSEERFEAIRNIENDHGGLWLGGNIRDGIGMADRVTQGIELARTAIGRELL